MKYAIVLVMIVLILSCESKKTKCQRWQAEYLQVTQQSMMAKTTQKTAKELMEYVCKDENKRLPDSCYRAKILVSDAEADINSINDEIIRIYGLIVINNCMRRKKVNK